MGAIFRGGEVKELECGLKESKFEHPSRYYFKFWTKTFGKSMSPYSTSHGINSDTTIPLQEWLWHWISHEGWYATKNKENKPKSALFKIGWFHGVRKKKRENKLERKKERKKE